MSVFLSVFFSSIAPREKGAGMYSAEYWMSKGEIEKCFLVMHSLSPASLVVYIHCAP